MYHTVALPFHEYSYSICDFCHKNVATFFQNRNVSRQKAQDERVVAGQFLPSDSYSGVLAVYMEAIQLRSEVLGKCARVPTHACE